MIYPADVVLFEGILVSILVIFEGIHFKDLYVDLFEGFLLSGHPWSVPYEVIRRHGFRYAFVKKRYGSTVFSLDVMTLKQSVSLLLIFLNCYIVVRDITERGRDLEQILTQYMTFVKPAFEEFCSPVSCPCFIVL